MASRALLSTSATLLLRVRDVSDTEAWNDFVDRYGPKILQWCRLYKLQESDSADVAQEVLTKLVGAMREFDYDPRRGSFRGWLKTVTANTVRDLARRWKRPAERGAGDSNTLAMLNQLADPKALNELTRHIEEQFQSELLAEAESRVRLRVQPRTWTAWKQATVQQLPAAVVAEHVKMSVAEVYVAKSRVTKMLREEVMRLDGGTTSA